MTHKKFAFPYEDLAAVFGFPFDKNYVKAHGWIGGPRRIPVTGEENQLGAGVRKADTLYCALFLP